MENYLRNKIPGPKIKSPKKKPNSKAVHTENTQKGMGDYYGTGIVQKLGKMRDDSMGMQVVSKTRMKKPPKSLA